MPAPVKPPVRTQMGDAPLLDPAHALDVACDEPAAGAIRNGLTHRLRNEVRHRREGASRVNSDPRTSPATYEREIAAQVDIAGSGREGEDAAVGHPDARRDVRPSEPCIRYRSQRKSEGEQKECDRCSNMTAGFESTTFRSPPFLWRDAAGEFSRAALHHAITHLDLFEVAGSSSPLKKRSKSQAST